MYGAIGVGKHRGKLFSLTEMVEAAARGAKSNLITATLHPAARIFDILAKGGEAPAANPAHRRDDQAKTQPFYEAGIRGAASIGSRSF
jgi:hypothetical protein